MPELKRIVDPELKRYFDELNAEYFGGELPDPIGIYYVDNFRKTSGMFYYSKLNKSGWILIEKKQLVYGVQEVIDTVLHEMVHFWEFMEWEKTKFCDISKLGDNSTLFLWKLKQVGANRFGKVLPKKEEFMEKTLVFNFGED